MIKSGLWAFQAEKELCDFNGICSKISFVSGSLLPPLPLLPPPILYTIYYILYTIYYILYTIYYILIIL